ncbi:YqjK-like family protein [Rhodoferax sp. UBA5149]|uniref:YqjK-like family protein n=1 Tax=Rhodoferax sp. UBA5149 TaxID=1947379 RepID=UPI0025F3A868|nr:YqjK-like family protein [Rhodoferax sp. UBA5149]
MNNDELVLRQQLLQVRSAQLRLTLADQVQVFKRPLAVADQAQSGLQWLYRNPLWPLGALVVLGVLRPRRVILWGGRVWWAWKTFNRARNLIASIPLPRR